MKATKAGAAVIETGRTFYSASGRWASEQLLRALNSGLPFSPDVLRTLDTLRKDEWKAFDEALIEEGMIRLRGVADLMAAGLTIPVANAMGKTLLEWEKVTDMNPAITSLSGIDRSEDDSQEFSLDSIPLPITHKDFNINLRTLSASRERGESLDTTQARTAGRLVAERLEQIYFAGGPTFGGKAIHGLTNHPDRNLANFGTNGAWSATAKTGENILADVLTLIAAAEAARMFGPYRIYVPTNVSTKLSNDFKANSDKTIRQRVLEVDGIQGVTVVDQLSTSQVLLVQMTRDVVSLVDGEGLQSVQWDVEGGFQVRFKAFAIQIPLIRSDAQGRSGVVHMT